MNIKDRLKKKIKKKRKALLIGAILTLAILSITGINSTSGLLLAQSGVISMTLWGEEMKDIEKEEPPKLNNDCPCKCVWVTNQNGQQSVTINTLNTSTGVQAKYLGKAGITQYGFADNDVNGKFGTYATSGEINALPGYTAAVGYKSGHRNTQSEKELGYSDKNTGCNLEKLWYNKIKNEFGESRIKISNNDDAWYWIYVEGLGVRLVHDRCGVGSKLDIFNAPNTEDYSKVNSLDGHNTNVWFLEYVPREQIKKFRQTGLDGVAKPIVDESTLVIPGYGASTGSLTNTSTQIQVPTPKNSNQRILLEHLLPGAVVASQYYNINIRMTLGTAPHEGSWNAVRDGNYNNYHLYSIHKPGPLTGKTTSNGWGTHIDYNDAIMDYATNFYTTPQVNNEFNGALSNYSYEAIIKAYNQGGEAQIKTMALSGYNDFKSSGAKTLEEYKAAAENYANKIISVTSNIPEIDNIDVALAYIQQNGLTDEYNKALAMKDRYEALYNKGYANATPNGSNSNNQSTNNTTDKSNGYWLCNCAKPCKLCNCHDKESSSNNNQSQSTTNSTFPQSVAGTASGLWGTAEQLAQYIEQLNSSNAPNGCGNIEQLKKNLRALIPMMGVSPVQPYTYATDKFVGSDGIGFVTYSQSRSFGIEPYFRSCYNNGSSTTFGSSGCGLYATAMVLSTLEKKWVNPAEVAIALQTYGVRNNKRINTTAMGGNAAAYETGLKTLIEEAGYNVKSTNGSVDIATLDDCLSNNGCMIYIVGSQSGLTSRGHYVVVREKTADGKYLMGNSNRRNNNTFTDQQIKTYMKGGKIALYVYPRVDPIKTTLGTTVGSGGQFSSLPTSTNNLNGELGDKIVAEANKHLGTKYVPGGSSPSGFDCSGLTQYSYSQCGVNIPRNSAEQYKNCKKITKDELQPGDLVFGSRDGKKVNHVMMYIGNGQVIHAPRSGKVVEIISLDSYKNQFGYGTYLR